MTDRQPAWFSPGRDTAEGGTVANPFDSVPAASRYVTGRPYYHGTALGLAASRLGISRVGIALDLGCGTGLSSRALRAFADRVIAVDPSSAMLRAAEPLADVWYLAAGAERIPLRDASVDLATVGAAFHWFDQPRAFAELSRVLRVGAGLVVYSDYFDGRLADQPAFTDWLTTSYLPSFPTPARHAYFDPEAARGTGFAAPSYEEVELTVPLTCAQLADYMLSQSNAAVAIEAGHISADALRRRIIDETRGYFPDDQTIEVVFGIRLWTTVREG